MGKTSCPRAYTFRNSTCTSAVFSWGTKDIYDHRCKEHTHFNSLPIWLGKQRSPLQEILSSVRVEISHSDTGNSPSLLWDKFRLFNWENLLARTLVNSQTYMSKKKILYVIKNFEVFVHWWYSQLTYYRSTCINLGLSNWFFFLSGHAESGQIPWVYCRNC